MAADIERMLLGVLCGRPLHWRTQEDGGIVAVQHVLCALRKSCAVNFSFQQIHNSRESQHRFHPEPPNPGLERHRCPDETKPSPRVRKSNHFTNFYISESAFGKIWTLD